MLTEKNKIGDPSTVKALFLNPPHEKRSIQPMSFNQEHFKKNFEHSPICMALVSIEGKWIKANKKLCQLLGYTEDELCKKTSKHLTHPDDLNADVKHLRQLQNGEIEAYQIDKRYLHKNGNIIWALLGVSLLKDADKQPLYHVAQIVNITETKNAETSLKTRDNLFTNLSEQLPCTVFQFQLSPDGRSRLPYASRTLWDFFEVTPEDVKYDSSKIFTRVHENDIDALMTSIRESYAKIKPWQFEFRVTLPLQGTKWLSGLAKPLKQKDGSMLWHGYIIDVSKKKLSELELAHSFKAINDQNKRLINFAYIVSHNLRSHSSNFKMILNLIEHVKSEDEKKELMLHLNKISSSLTETINHLSEVVSIHTTKDDSYRTKIHLKHYANKVIGTLFGEISANNVVIHNNIFKDLTIHYNPAYIESILLNFISNSIKYRHDERLPIITLNSYYDDSRVVLEIADNGKGINLEKYRDKLFSMYQTFHGNSDARGIGLFISKNQVEAMGGKIEVESEEGVGSIFKIYLT